MEQRLLPADIYITINKSIISDIDLKILNMLYLPITGSLAVMLYHTLLNDLSAEEILSSELEHAHLLSNLHVSLEELIAARHILEAIGLMKVYYKEDTVNRYIYELYSPMSAHEFFSHPVLNIVLYNNVGKKEYERLVSYFKMPKINKEGYAEITKTFSAVFESVPYTSSDMYNDNIRKYNRQKLNIDSSFDMNFLIETMPKSINNKIFTKDLQELIINLAYLYDIDAVKMQNILRVCVNENGTINREELRKTARNHYQFDHSGLLPTIVTHAQPEYLRKPIGDNSKLSKMIYTFETISPYDFLRSKHNGAEPVKKDVKLLEDLIVDYRLKPGVVNVLIDYVLKTNDNKINRSLVETIAGQWSRKNIETVEDAMEIAKKNYASRIKNKTVKNVTKDGKVPSWFDKNVEMNEASDQELMEMEEMLKEYR